MIPKELLRKIQKIDILTNRVVTEVMSGNYESVFKGQGIEFSEVREYQYGDDVRNIDWNVTAKMRAPYIKQYVEEREQCVMFLVDISPSTYFGTRSQFKRNIAAEIAALLAFSAIRNNDKVGLILFSDQVESYIPPRKDRKHVLRIVRDLLYEQGQGKGTNIAAALEYMNRTMRKKSIVFVISDFFDQGYEKAFRMANRRHDVIPIVLKDPFEEELPKVGLFSLEDPETGQIRLINSTSRKVRKVYSQNYQKAQQTRDEFFKKSKIDPIMVSTDQGYVDPVVRFFKRRAKQIR